MSRDLPHLITGRRIAGNVLWNLFGVGIPVFIALAAIPILVERIGTAKFGILTLAWATVGYFSLFDMGLGRAMTQMIARRLGGDDRSIVPSIFWTGLALMSSLGLFGGLSLVLLAPWFVQSVLSLPIELQEQTLSGFYLVALGLPLVVSTSGLQGVVEAYQNFRAIFFVKLIQGSITFAGPATAAMFTDDLEILIGTLLFGRLLTWSLLFYVSFNSVEKVRSGRFSRSLIKPFFVFGGWMTVGNLLAPVFLYADRVIIGSIISVTAVAYYVTPSEIIIKLLILPNSLLGVVFPLLAAFWISNPQRTFILYERSLRYIYIVMTPIAILGIGFASILLELWMGESFSAESYRVMQLLLVGIFFNSVAQLPSGLILAAGRPDIFAKLQMLQVPLYLCGLWLLVGAFGIEGAAFAWALRALFDGLLLLFVSARLLPPFKPRLAGMITTGMLTIVGLMVLILVPGTGFGQAVASVCLFVAFIPIAWMHFLSIDERQLVFNLARL